MKDAQLWSAKEYPVENHRFIKWVKTDTIEYPELIVFFNRLFIKDETIVGKYNEITHKVYYV